MVGQAVVTVLTTEITDTIRGLDFEDTIMVDGGKGDMEFTVSKPKNDDITFLGSLSTGRAAQTVGNCSSCRLPDDNGHVDTCDGASLALSDSRLDFVARI